MLINEVFFVNIDNNKIKINSYMCFYKFVVQV